jgi:hypothetical protein
MINAKTALAVSLAVLATAAHLRAQDPAAPPTTAAIALPATEPAPGEALNATVTDIVGKVRYRLTEDQPWQPATIGLVLPPGAEFQTGLKSAVRFTLPGGQTVTLDRLGAIKILTAIQEQGKITTDLGMKFGRTRWDIEKAGVEYSNTIRSPGATLAIRGTKIIYEDQAPWVPNAISTEGRAAFRNMRRQFIAFGGTKKAEIRSDKQSPGETALDGQKIDPKTTFAGRDPAEQKIITEIPGLAGLDPGSQASVIQIARDFGSATGNIGTPNVAGPLSFELSWQSINLAQGGNAATNLDLQVTDPLGNTLSKSHPQAGTGQAIGMHVGDQTGVIGVENVRWNELFPQGQYVFVVSNVSGDPAQVFVNVVRGQRDVKTVGSDPRNPLVLSPGQTFTGTVDIRGGDDLGIPAGAKAPRARQPGGRKK